MAAADKRCPLCASVFCLRADAERCRHTGQRRPVAAIPEAPEQAETPAQEPASPGPEPIDLQSLTVSQLRALAKEREVTVPSGANKAALIEALS